MGPDSSGKQCIPRYGKDLGVVGTEVGSDILIFGRRKINETYFGG